MEHAENDIDRLTERQALERLHKSFSNPVVFGEWLFESPLEEWQRDALRDFARGGRVARAVCNGGGKTRLFAIAGCWFLVVRKNPRVVMTAGVYRQLDAMRDELSIPYRNGKLNGFKLLEHELIHPDGSKFLWYSADNAGLFEGQHAEHLALLIDEAKSVPDEIALASHRLQATHTLAMSSPAAAVGWFYECFSSKKEFWRSKHVKASEVNRISSEWIQEMRAMHANRPELLASMLDAEFTSSDPNSFIQLTSINRNLQNPPRAVLGIKVAGIDLATTKNGDESVIVIRDGNKMTDIIAWRDDDAVRIASKCISELTSRGVKAAHVFADSGNAGGAIIDIMANMGYSVNRVGFGEAAISKNYRLGNRMTELWDNMREEIEMQRIILIDDRELKDQLTKRNSIPLASGKIKLETKAEMRSRGLSSPDRADALALCLCNPISHIPTNNVYRPMDQMVDRRGLGRVTHDGFDLGGL